MAVMAWFVLMVEERRRGDTPVASLLSFYLVLKDDSPERQEQKYTHKQREADLAHFAEHMEGLYNTRLWQDGGASTSNFARGHVQEKYVCDKRVVWWDHPLPSNRVWRRVPSV